MGQGIAGKPIRNCIPILKGLELTSILAHGKNPVGGIMKILILSISLFLGTPILSRADLPGIFPDPISHRVIWVDTRTAISKYRWCMNEKMRELQWWPWGPARERELAIRVDACLRWGWE